MRSRTSVRSSISSGRAFSATSAPSFAIAIAAARPMPESAPVTSTRYPGIRPVPT